MLLALDVGNTNAVFGLFKLAGESAKAGVVANWRITTPRDQTADEFGILLQNMFTLRGLTMDSVTGIAVSSVVPPLDSMIEMLGSSLQSSAFWSAAIRKSLAESFSGQSRSAKNFLSRAKRGSF